MAAQNAEGQASRPPSIDDLLNVCSRLNEAGVIYATAGIEYFEFKEVRIPIADITTMIETIQGIRSRDKEDLAFLKSRLEE